MLNSQHAIQAASQFSHCGVERILLDPAYANAQVNIGSGPLTMTTNVFQLGDFYTLRGVYIKSAKIEIANLFLFPTPQYHLPLHVLEVVMLSGKPIVAILDQVDLSSNNALATPQLVKLRQQHNHMINSTEIPEWFAECRSGSEFFLRPDHPDETTSLLTIHDNMLTNLAENCDNNLKLSPDQTEQHALRIHHYKQHHAENAPGKPLLTSAFGSQWTNHYFTEYLFA